MTQEKKCRFSFDVIAPNGLDCISKDIELSELNLHTYKSGYNGKIILRSKKPGPIELDMDSSDTEDMFGSGAINLSFDSAKKLAEKLNNIFRKHDLTHVIVVDNEDGEESCNFSYKWGRNKQK